jgi:hypothetical protein
VDRLLTLPGRCNPTPPRSFDICLQKALAISSADFFDATSNSVRSQLLIAHHKSLLSHESLGVRLSSSVARPNFEYQYTDNHIARPNDHR